MDADRDNGNGAAISVEEGCFLENEIVTAELDADRDNGNGAAISVEEGCFSENEIVTAELWR